MVKLRGVLSSFEVSEVQKQTEQSNEELGKERQVLHDRFLDQGWELTEWAPLKNWHDLEGEVVSLSALGVQLQQSHEQLLKACGGFVGCEEAVEEYLEMGRKLEEGVKFSCPWPQLREVMGRPKTQPANLSLGGGLSPSL